MTNIIKIGVITFHNVITPANNTIIIKSVQI